MHEEPLEMPRLSSTLRAFSSVSQTHEDQTPQKEKEMIRKRIQQLRHQTESTEKVTRCLEWSYIVNKLAAKVRSLNI